jgi:glycosyltransferase involved in cell wall biosynthesis
MDNKDSVEFWSSVQYGTFLKGLVRELGAGARQCYSVREVDYRAARGSLARLKMRWKCYISYPYGLKRRVKFGSRPNVLVVCTNTFFAPWVALRAARTRGVPVCHWVFDLFPDVLILAGKIREGSWGSRLLRYWVRRIFDGAAVNVFLGERLRAYAELKFGPIPRSVVIPIGCDATPFSNMPPAQKEHGRPIYALYCGNFGRMHETETLVGALRDGVPEGLAFEFRGNGAGYRELKRQLALNIGPFLKFGDNLPESEWVETMTRADVAIVTMRTGAEGVVMPSKTYSALAAGQAVLAVCPLESDLADLIAEHDCGWVVEPGDVVEIRRVFEEMACDGPGLLRRRSNAWRAGQECFDQRVLALSWREVFAAATLNSSASPENTRVLRRAIL